MVDEGKRILVVPATTAPDLPGGGRGSKGLFDGAPRAVGLDTDVLKKNLNVFVQSVQDVLKDLPQLDKPFRLDEIELTVEVSGEGSLQLVGGVKIGASGGITLKLKR